MGHRSQRRRVAYTFLLCVVPTSKVHNSIIADVTNKTISAVIRRIENRTRGDTANMVTHIHAALYSTVADPGGHGAMPPPPPTKASRVKFFPLLF